MSVAAVSSAQNAVTSDGDRTVRLVSLIMSMVIGLTFLFGFGNVLAVALRLGVSPWIAPLVAPAVDLSVVGLLLGIRRLSADGLSRRQLRPARRLLIFCSVVSLALNVADPLMTGAWGRAAFDAVGPLLLIGWAHVGPGLVHPTPSKEPKSAPAASAVPEDVPGRSIAVEAGALNHELLDRARREDELHRAQHQRPISAETLRTRLAIGAARSRQLVATVRAERGATHRLIRSEADSAEATDF